MPLQSFGSSQPRLGVYRKWIAGRYYGGNAGHVTTIAGGLNYLYLVPLWVPNSPQAIDRIGLEVTTAAASAVARLGIYSNDATTDQPNALLFEATSGGSLDCSTTGVKESTISQSLSGDLFWMALAVQGASFTFRALQGQIPPVAATSYAGGVATAVNNCYTWTGQSSTLPSTITQASLSATGLCPRLQVRAA